ncbi:hypothetical protein C8R45DRAFT_934754 [Mycena sanguinolenta]|nr:hypothetical protein C8R45DRAFT_934754 [Mycena sanguinolenta]
MDLWPVNGPSCTAHMPGQNTRDYMPSNLLNAKVYMAAQQYSKWGPRSIVGPPQQKSHRELPTKLSGCSGSSHPTGSTTDLHPSLSDTVLWDLIFSNILSMFLLPCVISMAQSSRANLVSQICALAVPAALSLKTTFVPQITIAITLSSA